MLEFLVSRFISKPTIAIFFALLILSVPALFSLTKPGFYTNHDGETHTARIAQYYLALKDGQFPPRFAESFYNGLGSPIFVYIYPLPYLTGAIIHVLGPSFSGSFKILMALSFIFSGFFTYLWLRAVFNSRSAAFAGAVFYVWAPYRLSLIYVRASISEILAYTFVPLTFWALTKLALSKKFIFVPLTAISIAAILLSQNLVALMIAPVAVAYVLILCISQKSKKALFLSALSAIWGLSISSITYLPALFERQYVHFDEIIKIASVNHFVTVGQLFHSPWGYGFDLPGTVNDQMSFQIGLAQILVAALTLVVITYLAIAPLKVFKTRLIVSPNRLHLALAIYFLIIFTLGAFLTLDYKYNLLIWSKVKIFQTIDLPWRFIGVCTVASSVLTAFVVKTFKPKILLVFLLALVFYANRNHLRINEQRFLGDDFFENYTGSATQYSEFAPKWRLTVKVPNRSNKDKLVEFYEGFGEVMVLEHNSKVTTATVKISSDRARILINKFFFPGAILQLNGKTLAQGDYTISNSMSGDINILDTSGLPRLDLPSGQYTISYRYSETLLRKTANVLTSLSLFGAIISTILLARKLKN